jgi:hypothetical protein
MKEGGIYQQCHYICSRLPKPKLAALNAPDEVVRYDVMADRDQDIGERLNDFPTIYAINHVPSPF